MATERAILCGAVSGDRLPVGDPDPLRLCLRDPGRNVHLTIEDVRRAMWRDIPPAFLDLIEIATFVYCADQAVTRGGTADAGFGEGWRRRLFFRIPVREPDLWGSNDVLETLVSVLSFLTEDSYHFEFEPLRRAAQYQDYFEFNSAPAPPDVEEVLLFSGGLDSLGGAVQEAVLDRRHVVLVNHRSTTKLSNRQRDLQLRLGQHAQPAPPVHVPVRINKSKRFSREFTQRSRSFVYASLGAAVAVMLGLRRVRFYENGVVSLNLPPSAQVVGARASRTTHPQALNGFGRLFSALAGRAFAVENPFRWQTKAAVVRLITRAGCGDLIRHTTSCGHTWERTREHSHCGKCSQCIDRRFAVLAAGEGAADPADAYEVDLLTGPREEGHPRTMLAVYAAMATRIEKMNAVQFFGQFGEAARVLRHADGDPEATALRIFNMYRDHARDVNKVIDQAIGQNAAGIRDRLLPPSCLIRLVCDASAAQAPSAREKPPVRPLPEDNVFRRKGQAWEVRFEGSHSFILLPSKGAAYLHVLLSSPGTAISAADLACRVAKNRQRYALSDAGEVTDREGLAAYHARLQELEQEIAEAKDDHDFARHEQLEEEREQLRKELRRATGLGGRLKKAGDDRKRVRQAVGTAIRRAVKDLAGEDPRLADHLQSPRLRCGFHLIYQPAPEVRWAT